jgi:hypothetical protein
MLRSILLSSVLAFLYFTGCASQASADIAAEVYSFNGTVPGATIDFAGSCDSVDFPFFPSPCPSAQGLPVVFNVPQFNPSLGSLQSVSLRLFLDMGGTAAETAAPILNCNGLCGNAAGGELTFGPVISFSTGGGPSYTVSQFFGGPGLSDTTEIFAPIPAGGGTLAEAFPSFNNSDTGIFDAVPFYFPGDPGFDAFVGTGHVSFNIYSVLDLDSFSAEYSAITLDPTPFFQEATLEYDYIPSVLPEPSLVIMTGGIFGFLVSWRVRRRRASSLPTPKCFVCRPFDGRH